MVIAETLGHLPEGASRTTCVHCGIPVWRVRLGRADRPKLGGRTVIFLTAVEYPGTGAVVIRNSHARFAPGNYQMHKCPAKVLACKYCGEKVRIVGQPPGAVSSFAVLDAEPDPSGIVTIREDGFAVMDRPHLIPGHHYRWHTKHGGEDTTDEQ